MAIAPGPYLLLIVRLAHRRRDLGLSQVELDRRLGIAQGLVSKWECGIRSPSPFMLCIWAEALGSELLIRTAPESAKPETVERWKQLEFDFNAPKPPKRKHRRKRGKRGRPRRRGRKRRAHRAASKAGATR